MKCIDIYDDDLIQLVDKFLFQAMSHSISGCRNGSKGAAEFSMYHHVNFNP